MSGTRSRTNRLRRSVRQSQAADRSSSAGDESAQTPRRRAEARGQTPVRSRLGADSAHNESFSTDVHQDIVWDTTSPSPHRLGKRGLRLVGSVTISDIVNRIAPKVGRPRVVEPVLLQWIRDTIPCTPELHTPKQKKKNNRPNGVDDLLSLARQFDYNMLHETHTDPEQDPDLDPDPDIGPTQNPSQNPGPDWVSDDDLDFLFDGSTQGASGAFSPDVMAPNVTQNFSRVKTPDDFQSKSSANAPDATEELGKSQASSRSLQKEPIPPRLEPNPTEDPSESPLRLSAPKPEKLNSQNKIFKFKSLSNSRSDDISPKLASPVQTCDLDDWADDDFLEDSLLLEMTQNPFGFLSPNSTSTQKNVGKTDGARQTFALTANTNFSSNLNARLDADGDFRKTSEQTRSDFNVGSTGNVIYPNSTTRQNKTSKTLKENSHRNIGAKWSDAKQPAGFSIPPNDYSSKPSQNVSKCSAEVSQNNSSTSKPAGGVCSETNPRSEDVWASKRATAAAMPTPDANTFRKTSHGFHSNSAAKSNSNSVFQSAENMRATESSPANPDDGFGDDLDAIFSSDPIWDDLEDDELLCELCDDVESQIQNTANQSQRAGQTANQSQRAGQTANQSQRFGQGSDQNQQMDKTQQTANQTQRTVPAVNHKAVLGQRAGHWVTQVNSAGPGANQTPRTGPGASQTWSSSGAPQQRHDFNFKRPAPVPPPGPPTRPSSGLSSGPSSAGAPERH
ncbi:ewing's tumor-associated antigen 1 [Boleophthalmus pectinirostris]|uniref:ewing's tumor-associated antigen 1 n=1 Tax=Boleophthalmus pectinirostris TaxID=150288 RepID=UPI00242A8C9D|nr:ewing's tumor-associated antigen 1 [Boleophthalmus pectinirostris]